MTTATTQHETLTVSDLLKQRHNCRYGLRGLRIQYKGAVYIIDSSAWSATQQLLLRSGHMVILARDAVLLDKWPRVCC